MNHEELQTQLLQEAVRWLRFQSIDRAKSVVEKFLDTNQKKAVFDMTDGTNSIRTIAAKVGVSIATISKWWGVWFSAGILFEHEGTYKKLFNLSDLGIESPDSAEGESEERQTVNGKRKS